MAAIVHAIEIARRPEDVFAYATDFSHGSVDGDAPLAVGSRAVVTRRVGPRKLARIEEITELNPPRAWMVRGVGGPLTAIAKGTIEPVGGGERSLVTIALEFEGHGIGKLLIPLIARPQARRQLPRNGQRLKVLLERDG